MPIIPTVSVLCFNNNQDYFKVLQLLQLPTDMVTLFHTFVHQWQVCENNYLLSRIINNNYCNEVDKRDKNKRGTDAGENERQAGGGKKDNVYEPVSSLAQ